MNILLNKYRPVFLDDFEKSKSPSFLVIKKLIQLDKLNIILVGKECSGKTTLINSIIKEYYSDNSQVDGRILRISVLNEHGINYYKNDVKTFCQTNLQIGNHKKKIIILDDFCSISEEGQIYFKYLMEKYVNVHFIASTNHLHKITKPILSYFICINIPILDKDDISNVITNIVDKENIQLCPNNRDIIIDFLINTTNYNIKMVINILEKMILSNCNPVTLENTQMLSNNISYISLGEYTHHVLNNELIQAIDVILDLYQLGFSVVDILYEYFQFIKNQPFLSDYITDKQKHIIITIITKYIAIFYETTETTIELTFFTNEIVNMLGKCDSALTHK